MSNKELTDIHSALQDLLHQVETFCAQHGEADFETGRARAALAAQPVAQVPEGMKLVPLSSLENIRDSLRDYQNGHAYSAEFDGANLDRLDRLIEGLAAAPSPEASKPVQAEAPSDKDRADYWQGRAIVAERKLASHSPASGVVERDENGNLPCPFCGGECDPAGWLGGDGKRGPECEECGATAESTEVWNARAAIATQPLEQKPVAWCELTAAGSIAYFDGKPMVMCGPVGNEHHPHALYPGQQSEQVAQDSAPELAAWLLKNHPHSFINPENMEKFMREFAARAKLAQKGTP